ncbi:MAG: hypothetical protein ACTSO4_13035 [Promethearchaeota archaeon]
MVATIENFEKSKELFKQGDVSSTLDIIEKTIDQLDRNNNIAAIIILKARRQWYYVTWGDCIPSTEIMLKV